MQICLPHTKDCFGEVDKDYDNQFDSIVSKDNVCKVEGRKHIEFYERNILEMLREEYVMGTKGEYAFVNQLGKSIIDNVLMFEGTFKGLGGF
jgi:hypothetical protein